MIYTVTFNPAIDYIVYMDGLELGETNRTKKEEHYFGGKGINVSIILNELGVETAAMGFVSGYSGRALQDGLLRQGIKTAFIELPEDGGVTRINVKIKDTQADGSLKETEINGQGPKITDAALEQLFARINELTADDMLIVSGSIPSSMPEDTYERILSMLADGEGTRFPVVVDATGDLLLNVLKYHPFMIKPNNDELGEMLGTKTETTEEIIEGAKKLREMGARNVIISRGKHGAVMVTEDDEVIVMDPLPGKPVNTVGAGDSMVAGFVTGYIHTGDYEYAMKLGSAAGSATACSPGLATREEIERRIP